MKKLFMMAAVAGLLASCGGGKGGDQDAAKDSVVVEIPAVVYYGETKAVPGDKNEIEVSVKIAEGDTVGTYEILKTYTYGQTGQQVRTKQDGVVISSIGTKNSKTATLWTMKKDGEDDKISYYEVLITGDSIVELAPNKGRSADWKDFIFIKK